LFGKSNSKNGCSGASNTPIPEIKKLMGPGYFPRVAKIVGIGNPASLWLVWFAYLKLDAITLCIVYGKFFGGEF